MKKTIIPICLMNYKTKSQTAVGFVFVWSFEGMSIFVKFHNEKVFKKLEEG